jgi:acylphosphatase
MTDAELRIVRIYVEGRVQGVGYRAFFAQEAERLAVAGWVRNRFDGRVEAVAAGPAAAIEALLAAARRGPAYARIDRVREEPADETALGGRADRFRVAPSA